LIVIKSNLSCPKGPFCFLNSIFVRDELFFLYLAAEQLQFGVATDHALRQFFCLLLLTERIHAMPVFLGLLFLILGWSFLFLLGFIYQDFRCLLCFLLWLICRILLGSNFGLWHCFDQYQDDRDDLCVITPLRPTEIRGNRPQSNTEGEMLCLFPYFYCVLHFHRHRNSASISRCRFLVGEAP